MKYFILFIGSLLLATHAGGQITITDDPDYNTTDPSASLEVKSTSKGLLLPRVTTSEQRSIQDPVLGLVVFNTDSADFYGFDGTVWKAIFNPSSILLACPDSIEYSGKWYKAVQIGEQCWMAENLNVGTRIDGVDDPTDNGTIEKYCYNDEPDSCDVYGGLYQWDEMMQYTTQAGAQGICPAGWRLPSDAEWKELEGTVDTQYPVGDPEWDGTSFRGNNAGKRLKSTSGWDNIGNGTDAFGFTALPGGNHQTDGSFVYQGERAIWWTTTEDGGTDAWHRSLSDNEDRVGRNSSGKYNGFSVRCLRD